MKKLFNDNGTNFRKQSPFIFFAGNPENAGWEDVKTKLKDSLSKEGKTEIGATHERSEEELSLIADMRLQSLKEKMSNVGDKLGINSEKVLDAAQTQLCQTIDSADKDGNATLDWFEFRDLQNSLEKNIVESLVPNINDILTKPIEALQAAVQNAEAAHGGNSWVKRLSGMTNRKKKLPDFNADFEVEGDIVTVPNKWNFMGENTTVYQGENAKLVAYLLNQNKADIGKAIEGGSEYAYKTSATTSQETLAQNDTEEASSAETETSETTTTNESSEAAPHTARKTAEEYKTEIGNLEAYKADFLALDRTENWRDTTLAMAEAAGVEGLDRNNTADLKAFGTAMQQMTNSSQTDGMFGPKSHDDLVAHLSGVEDGNDVEQDPTEEEIDGLITRDEREIDQALTQEAARRVVQSAAESSRAKDPELNHETNLQASEQSVTDLENTMAQLQKSLVTSDENVRILEKKLEQQEKENAKTARKLDKAFGKKKYEKRGITLDEGERQLTEIKTALTAQKEANVAIRTKGNEVRNQLADAKNTLQESQEAYAASQKAQHEARMEKYRKS